MTSTANVQVAQGWYPDPLTLTATGGATHRRWWDGTAWTMHVAPIAEVVTESARSAGAPLTVTPRDSARTAESMPLHAGEGIHRTQRDRIAEEVAAAAPHSTITPATTASPHSVVAGETDGYEPFSPRRRAAEADVASRVSSRNPLGLRVHTASIWLMATMPVTQALLIFWVFNSLPPESSAWTRALTVALPFVLYAALASQDNRQLEASGHLRTTPWMLAFVMPPLHLAVRGLRVARATGATPWPLLVWAVVQAVVVVVWWLVDPAAVQALIGVAL